MNRRVWFCSQPTCKESLWLLYRSRDNPHLWTLVSCVDRVAWTIAGMSPVCPLCGGELDSRLDLADKVDLSAIIGNN